MSKQTLRFSNASSTEAGSYKFLELPPELLRLVDDEVTNNFTIKGESQDDAVLCTADKTYTVRSVILSNLVLVATRELESNDEDTVVIRDQVQEILELAPCLPKLQKLGTLLRGMDYDEGQEDVEMEDEDDGPRRSKRVSYEDARAEVQASDGELAQGIIDRRILVIDGYLRPIEHPYLTGVLEQLLNALIASSLDHTKAPVDELVGALWDEHEVPQTVSTQIITWFGEVKDGLWAMDAESVVREVGLGILRHHRHDPIKETEFLSQWAQAVGSACEGVISIELLSGNYLASTSQTQVRSLLYFPASELSPNPATRFADLFLTRPRWSSDEITPFLADLAVNAKERDKLLLKYARAAKDGQTGVFYTARAQYNR